MFRSNRPRPGDTTSTTRNGSSNSLSEGKDNTSVTTPQATERTNREPPSAFSRSTTPTRPSSHTLETSDPFSFWDASADVTTTTTTTATIPNAATSTRHPTSAASASTLPPSALQAAYERGSESATTAADQIVADKKEVVDIIANYAVEPLEMLHLVDRWLQELLSDFKQQRDQFKHRLSEKWQNEELTNLKYDNNDRIRRIYAAYKELDTARNTILSREAFDELNNYLRKTDESATDEMKERFDSLARDYLKILQCLEFLDREIKRNIGSSDDYINNIKKNVFKLRQMNNKQSHTICIVGLEKAGKSTFINALLGFELLPTAAERCTQIRTVLKPPTEDGNQPLFATVKFYDDEEFHLFFGKMVKKTDETQQQLEERKRQAIEARETLKVKFPEEHFRINNINDIERERTAIRGQLHDYITGEVYVNIIKEITIYTDKLPGM